MLSLHFYLLYEARVCYVEIDIALNFHTNPPKEARVDLRLYPASECRSTWPHTYINYYMRANENIRQMDL